MFPSLHGISHSDNIFSQDTSTINSIMQSTTTMLSSIIEKLRQLMVNNFITTETTERVSQKLVKTKQFLQQNKLIVFGGLIMAIYLYRHRKQNKNKKHHLLSLTTSPIKRSHKKHKKASQSVSESGSFSTKWNKSQNKNLKLSTLKAFISEGQEEDQQSISQVQQKQLQDLSTSTKRTDSILSDIEPMRKVKKKNLQPIADLVEEDDQPQDKVFFQVYKTYMCS